MYKFFNGWTFRCLTDAEIIQGTELLAGLNKKSSNGYKCLKKKEEYVDFENGASKKFFLLETRDAIMIVYSMQAHKKMGISLCSGCDDLNTWA